MTDWRINSEEADVMEDEREEEREEVEGGPSGGAVGVEGMAGLSDSLASMSRALSMVF